MKSTIKATAVAVMVAVVGVPALTSTPVYATGIPVFDGAAAANFLQQMMKMKEQIDTLRNQLKQAERMYSSVTGVRGFGDVLRNPHLREYLPDNAATIYYSAKKGGYDGISGTIDEILESEDFKGTIEDMQTHIVTRQRESGAIDKAIGRNAYAGAEERLDQIDALIDQINATHDQKGIDELQARIAGEQAAIQNEMTKLQMLSQLQVAEQRLIAEQKREMNRRILSTDNEAMPGIY
ncbi:TPA: P-type DNA transfer protein VirB5 [Vibrio parahaemolyticus]|nr:P-type DNA transfer protein VirB5 [Vibrio parahaemolyticus]